MLKICYIVPALKGKIIIMRWWHKVKIKVVLCIVLLIFQLVFWQWMYFTLIYKKELNCQIFNSTSSIHHHLLRRKTEENLLNVLSKYHPGVSIRKGNDKWLTLMKDLYVYSAYFDDCPLVRLSKSSCVKFIAITLNNEIELNTFAPHVKCAFKDEVNSVVKIGTAEFNRIEESHGDIFTAAHVFCPLQSINETVLPKYASLFIDLKPNLTWLPILVEQVPFVLKDVYLSVCVRPFFGSILNLDLGEFITYYSMMGVDHFIFYEMNVSRNRDVFLKIVKHFGINLEIHSWNIPLNNSLIHQYGQIAFNQECVSRSKLFSTYTLVVDLDEFIVPKKHKDLKMLLSYLEETYPNAGSFVVLNIFFCDEFDTEGNIPSPFRIFFRNKHQKTVWEHWYRSKLIIRSDRVNEVGIHFVWKHKKNMKEIYLPPSLALLQHYKSCCYNQQEYFFHLLSFNVVEDNVIVDNSLAQLENKFTLNNIIKFIQNPLEHKPKLNFG